MYAFGTNSTKEQVQVSLKLMVNKETNKVLFAEAGKDFVDVLISFLTLPLGTIARLVAKESSDMLPAKVGSLSSLYECVPNLDEQCLWTDTCKEMLLHPRNSMEDYCRSLKLNLDDTEPTKYYVCDNLESCRHKSRVMLATFKNKKCSCGYVLTQQISPQSSNVLEGFIQNDEYLIITDDLHVVPNALDTMFCLLKNIFGKENIPSVEEMWLNVTKNKVLDLLKCSLLSKTTLTDVFLEKKPFLEKYELARLPLCEFAADGCSEISVKVMYRKSDCKIVFAQGNEDFADFLLSFLTYPLGGVLRLLEGSSMGSVDGLYKSIVDLNADYFKTKEVKDTLVDLRLAPQFKLSNQILPFCESDAPTYFCYTRSHNFFKTNNILVRFYLTPTYKEDCDNYYETCRALDIVDPISKIGISKGFAKGPTMFVATDDLVVTPLSYISVISILNRTNTSMSDLEEKVVSIGFKEGLNILKASLTSNSALTNGLGDLLTRVKEEK